MVEKHFCKGKKPFLSWQTRSPYRHTNFCTSKTDTAGMARVPWLVKCTWNQKFVFKRLFIFTVKQVFILMVGKEYRTLSSSLLLSQLIADSSGNSVVLPKVLALRYLPHTENSPAPVSPMSPHKHPAGFCNTPGAEQPVQRQLLICSSAPQRVRQDIQQRHHNSHLTFQLQKLRQGEGEVN